MTDSNQAKAVTDYYILRIYRRAPGAKAGQSRHLVVGANLFAHSIIWMRINSHLPHHQAAQPLQNQRVAKDSAIALSELHQALENLE